MKNDWLGDFLDPGITKTTKRIMTIGLVLLIGFSVHVGAANYSRETGSDGRAKGITNNEVQQKKTIRGKVTDENGEALPGVTVVVKGTSVGVATSMAGTFTLEVPDGFGTLVFSFVGMNTKEVKITDQIVINVQLTENTIGIEDVVVIGYQEVRRENTTASIVSITSEDIENSPSPSFENVLQGQLAGVNIQSLSGAPGVKNVFVIRGNTKLSTNIEGELNAGGTGFSNPLYVVDGVPTTLEDLAGYDATNTNFLSSLNLNDIESIDILKDASAAAIYGSRGANGVVLIKTKKGKTGDPEFTFNSYAGYTKIPDLVPVEIGTAERAAKFDLINNYWGYAFKRDRTPIMLTDSLNPFFNNNVDYQNLFYQNGITQNYDFGVSGGTEKTNYRVSLGYYDEDGIVTNTGFQRISATINLGIKFSDRLENQTILRIGHVDRKTGLGNASEEWGTFPIDPIAMNSSLFYLPDAKRESLLGQYKDIRNKNINITTQLSNNLRFQIIKGLHFNNMIALALNTTKKDFFSPTYLNGNNKTYAFSDYGGSKTVTIDNYLSYTKDITAKHVINALAGQSLNYNQNEMLWVSGTGAPSNNVKTVTGIPMEYINGGSDFTENGMISFWGRLGYKYNDRYLLDFNFRTDGSSRFGANTRWGYFPAISAGWIFSRESFVENNLSWITYGKLRGSWGINGSQFSDDYLRFNTYNSGEARYAPYGTRPTSTYNGVTVVNPNYSKIANEDLSWEQSEQWSVGVDLELFNRRVYITPEIYNRETKRLLFDVTFPIETGYNNSQANVAGVRNYGWELSAEVYTMKPGKDFQWQIGGNVAQNTNQITELPNGGRDYVTGSRSLTVGLPLNQYYLLLNTGEVYSTLEDIPIDPLTGNVISIQYNGLTRVGTWAMVDVDGNGMINFLEDKMVIPNASPNPKFTGGFSNTFKYKRWNLQINSSFTLGRTIYNRTLARALRGISWNNNIPVLRNINYWRQPGDIADMAALEPGVALHIYQRDDQSHWLENGDYFKIGSATLSYNFDSKKIKKFGLKGLRAYSTATNLAMFQKSSVPDAERVNVSGYDLGTGYANPFKFIFGVNVKF